jgi:hypothetical protein
MKGAQPIDAIDIDNCYLNSIENAEHVVQKHITVLREMRSSFKRSKIRFNYKQISIRNILLNDMQEVM